MYELLNTLQMLRCSQLHNIAKQVLIKPVEQLSISGNQDVGIVSSLLFAARGPYLVSSSHTVITPSLPTISQVTGILL